MIITQHLQRDSLFNIDLSFREKAAFDAPTHEQTFHKLLASINNLCRILDVYDGFLAGGFVRDLLYLQRNNKNVESIEIISHLESCLHRMGLGLTNYFKDFQQNDVDIYFESQEGYERFLIDYPHYFQNHSSSIGGNAIESYLDNKKIQIIDKRFGTPSEIIQGFDLLPSKVALKGDVLFLDDRWEQFEDDRCLHVDNWTSVNTIKRVYKYSHRGFKSLSSSTKRDMLNIAKSYASLSKEEREKEIIATSVSWHILNIISLLKEDFSIQNILDYVPINLPGSQSSSYTIDEINGFRDQIMTLLLQRSMSKILPKMNS